jgi:hypothetical protein
MIPQYPLARLAGAQPDILLQAKADRIKYGTIGGVLLTTAGMAGVSSAFALTTAMQVPVGLATLAGLLWAVVIFNLDRMLIAGMNRQTGFLKNLLAAIPRVVLAFVIGAVISVPLVLQIFRSEISNELHLLRAEHQQEGRRQIDEAYADIPGKQQRADQLQAIASGQQQPNVSDDGDVKAAQTRVDQAQAAYTAAAAKAQCELDGSCGTGRVGVGKAYQDAKAEADKAASALAAAKTDLTNATNRATEKINGSVASNQTTAQQELAILRPDLDQRLKDKAEALKTLTDSETKTDGLLARIEAMDHLADRNSSMGTATLLLNILFLMVEVLPVLAKLLTMIGPPTLYDRLLSQEEEHVATSATKRIGVADELNEFGKAEQVRLGKEARTLLAGEQFEIAKKAIDTWATIAKSRADEELRNWYAANAGQPTGGTSQVPAAQAGASQTTGSYHKFKAKLTGPGTNGSAIPQP